MPWTVDDVDGFKAGLTPAQKRRWVAIANSVLEECQESGRSTEDCEASAIKQANGALNEAAVPPVQHIDSDVEPLLERSKTGEVRNVRILRPGWGSSGYYSPSVIKAAADMFDGAKMYWNHPTPSEMKERPERDLNDLAATIVGRPKWQDNGPSGPGLYGQAKVFSPFVGPVDELAKHIGVSINAWGRGKLGEAEGRKGKIVEEITRVESVDFVTQAGAGGEVVALFEAARNRQTDPEEETGMADETELKEAKGRADEAERQLKEAQAKVVQLEEQQKAATSKLATFEARDKAAAELKDSKLPGIAKLRVIEAAVRDVQPGEDGKVDDEKIKEAVATAAKAEEDYLGRILGRAASGGVKGMGDAGTSLQESEVEEKVEDALKESFARFGFDEKQAGIAGRLRS